MASVKFSMWETKITNISKNKIKITIHKSWKKIYIKNKKIFYSQNLWLEN